MEQKVSALEKDTYHHLNNRLPWNLGASKTPRNVYMKKQLEEMIEELIAQDNPMMTDDLLCDAIQDGDNREKAKNQIREYLEEI